MMTKLKRDKSTSHRYFVRMGVKRVTKLLNVVGHTNQEDHICQKTTSQEDANTES